MRTAYVDANVLLRAVTGELAERAAAILGQAENGRLLLRVRTVIVAEGRLDLEKRLLPADAARSR